LASGSQRKSWADKKKVRIAQTASEATAIKKSPFQGSRPVDSILQFRDEVSGGKEEAYALDDLGQTGKRNRRAG